MVEMGYLAALGLAAFVSISNWRMGLFLIVLFDVLRDPVRKYSQSHSVAYTLVMNGLWLTTFFGAFLQQGNRMLSITKRYPQLGQAFQLFVVGLLPGAMLSIVLYEGGWKLAMIGIAAYSCPLIGILIGYVFLRTENDFWKLISFYVLINTVAVCSTFFEFYGYQSRLLGGIDMEWIRYRQGYIIDLMSGIYRSPDILGLHAAHVIFFSMMLIARNLKSRVNIAWVIAIVICAIALLLCGRRKMIVLPAVYLASYFLVLHIAGTLQAGKVITLGLIVFIAGGIFYLAIGESTENYTDYASSVSTESSARIRVSLIGSPMETIRQSGIFGSGLGSVTQGSHYIKTSYRRAWQEDGLGRLVAEFGLIGLAFLLLALWLLIRTIHLTIKNAPRSEGIMGLLAGLTAILISNIASFMISHQAYSGDPTIVLLVGMFIGIILSAPRRSAPSMNYQTY